jgi:multiple sugar transport system substrate-binding protein
MACVRSAIWSLVKMFEMWLRTVLGLTYRSLAILALLWLWAMRSSTCFSEERNAFVDGTIHPASVGEGLYGVPRSLDAGMLYYRRDLLEESGYSEPPKTWEELKEMAAKVVKDQGTTYGYIFQGADYEGGVCNGLEFVCTHGGEVLNPNDASKVIIASPESAAALATERSMVSEGVAPQGVADYRELESDITFMLHGDAVFCRQWPVMYWSTPTRNRR